MLGILRILVLPTFLLAFLLPGVALADNVDRLIRQLESSRDFKIRLSAAVNLGKLGDQRAVAPLVAALRDDERNVRGVAATSLGSLVGRETPDRLRTRAERALRQVAARDSSSFVREQARRALDAIGKVGVQGAIYVNIGGMSDNTSQGDRLRGLMRKTVEKTLAKSASSMVTEWPGGKEPSARQIKENDVKAFHVDGTLVSLTTEAKGSSTLVSCKVSMLIATFPKKSMFGFLDGGAKVQSDSSPRSVQYAQEDCVAAVVEDLVARRIIPTIQTRSP